MTADKKKILEFSKKLAEDIRGVDDCEPTVEYVLSECNWAQAARYYSEASMAVHAMIKKLPELPENKECPLCFLLIVATQCLVDMIDKLEEEHCNETVLYLVDNYRVMIEKHHEVCRKHPKKERNEDAKESD